MASKTLITKDLGSRKLNVTREFNAPVEKVWQAWTESSLLDKWWAPKPWKADTKIFDFVGGGMWLYSMVGPDGTKVWCKVTYKTITAGRSFSSVANFCDEEGNIINPGTGSHWLVEFIATGTGTKVEVELTFEHEADMEKLVAMGFEGGFTMGLNNLEELLEG